MNTLYSLILLMEYVLWKDIIKIPREAAVNMAFPNSMAPP